MTGPGGFPRGHAPMPASGQRGVGLVEVMIAVLILAVGTVGVMSMQLASQRMGYEATQRSVATSLARDILERMRSNPDQLAQYVADEIGGAALAAGKDCGAASCTPQELAARDLYEWNELLLGAAEQYGGDGEAVYAGGLLDARACITHAAGEVSVAISWRGIRELDNPDESACGEGSGLYGDGNEYRRLMVMSTFIGNT